MAGQARPVQEALNDPSPRSHGVLHSPHGGRHDPRTEPQQADAQEGRGPLCREPLGPGSWASLALFYLFFLLSSVGTLGAEETVPPEPSLSPSESTPSLPTSSPTSPDATTAKWDDLESLFGILIQASEASELDYETLYNQLLLIETEVNSLRTSAGLASLSLKNSEQLRSEEQKLYRSSMIELENQVALERSRLVWYRYGVLGAGVLALTGWAAFAFK